MLVNEQKIVEIGQTNIFQSLIATFRSSVIFRLELFLRVEIIKYTHMAQEFQHNIKFNEKQLILYNNKQNLTGQKNLVK